MSTDRPLQVLILGAGGVFGSRLAKLASRERPVRLTLGGRRRVPLDALAADLGDCGVRVVDRDRVDSGQLVDFDLVIDCAGPFQGSHTLSLNNALPPACIMPTLPTVAIRLLDRRFDEAAKRAGIAVVSGVSSIPALSHAVLDSMTLAGTGSTTSASGSFRAIVRRVAGPCRSDPVLCGQAGPVFGDRQWRSCSRAGRWRARGLRPCRQRWGAYATLRSRICSSTAVGGDVGPIRCGPRAALAASRPVVPFLAGPLGMDQVASARGRHPVVDRSGILPVGSDRGAMVVEVTGIGPAVEPIACRLALDATANLGPLVPAIPAWSLIRRLRDPWRPAPGAYPNSGILNLDELETLLDELGIGLIDLRQPEHCFALPRLDLHTWAASSFAYSSSWPATVPQPS